MERKKKANRGGPGIWGTFLLEATANSEGKSGQETKQSFQQTPRTKLTKCEFQGMPRRSSGKDSRIWVGTLNY